MSEKVIFEYDVKCRRCGKITEMYFSDSSITSFQQFENWKMIKMNECIEMKCTCKEGRLMIHDFIAFSTYEYPY